MIQNGLKGQNHGFYTLCFGQHNEKPDIENTGIRLKYLVLVSQVRFF
jgi:hypothetical protein